MRLEFLRLPLEERRLYLEQVAVRKNISPVIIEKDFWVCWMLAILYESKFVDALVFKGGTSLSKVFGVIDRFSEDIDLSLSPEFLGLKPAGNSRNQAEKWMKAAEIACGAAEQKAIAPVLEAAKPLAIFAGTVADSKGKWRGCPRLFSRERQSRPSVAVPRAHIIERPFWSAATKRVPPSSPACGYPRDWGVWASVQNCLQGTLSFPADREAE